MAGDTGIPLLPPAEAIDYFRAKGFHTGFAWQDVWQEEHARAFTVAKAMSRDVLETIRAAVDKALAEGRTLEQFRAELTPQLQKLGWWGRQRILDPATGQAKMVQLGSPRRLKIIFDMNMRMARAAGLWEKIQRSKDALPYLRYTAVMDDRTRPEHAEWHGTILPVDDPWWDTHYPPCGWNCRCTVTQLDADTIADRGWEISDTPPPAGKPEAWTNPRTGETIDVPAGIDPGFGYNVGRAHLGASEPPPLPPPARPGPVPKGAPEPVELLPAEASEAEAIDAFLGEALAAPEASAPVAELTGTELAPVDAPIGELRDAARMLFDTYRAEPPPVNRQLGSVQFSRRGAKKAIDLSAEHHGGADKLRATPAVRAVIEQGRVVAIEPNAKPEKERAIAYARIQAPVRIAGRTNEMEVLVEQQANGQWYYNHQLLEAQSDRPLQSGGVSDAGAEAGGGRTVPKSGGRSAEPDIGADGKNVDAVRYDPAGWPQPIGRGWFRDAGGAMQVEAGERRRVLPLVGRALAQPDEVRLLWVAGADGTRMLMRRYVATIDGLAIVVDVGKAGWRYQTARDAGFDIAAMTAGARIWPSSP